MEKKTEKEQGILDRRTDEEWAKDQADFFEWLGERPATPFTIALYQEEKSELARLNYLYGGRRFHRC